MNLAEINYLTLPARHTHANMQLVQGRTQITKARQIAATLGTSVAAAYLRNRNYSIEACLFILLGK